MSAIKILIIEDEVLIAEHIKDYLVGLKVDVYGAYQKTPFVNSYVKPDLILLDLHLQQPRWIRHCQFDR